METKEELDVLQEFVETMQATSKSTEKALILRDYGTHHNCVMDALYYTLSPFKKYHVTSKNCKKLKDKVGVDFTAHDSIWLLLDELDAEVITGHDAVRSVLTFIDEYPEHEDLIYSIVDKKMNIRASAKSVNKVFPDHIPVFNIALAEPFDDKRVVCWQQEEWLASRKLDGVRCLTIFNPDAEDVVVTKSREGHEFKTLDVVKQKILDLNLEMAMVFDGEICIMDEDGKEDFSGIMSEISKKNHTIENPRYVLFDALTLEEFENENSHIPLLIRINRLNSIGIENEAPDNDNTLTVLKQELVKSQSHFIELSEWASDMGYEGLIIRKNVGYLGKRSFDMMKVKEFHDSEYIAVATKNDVQQIVEDGVEKSEDMLKSVIIIHQDNEVDVGSGWSREQRRHYYKHPEDIIGKAMTIQYFETSKNKKTGKFSLRFPTLKHVWETDERDL